MLRNSLRCALWGAASLPVAGLAWAQWERAHCSQHTDTVSNAMDGGQFLYHEDQMHLNLALRLKGPAHARFCLISFETEDGLKKFTQGGDVAKDVASISAVDTALGSLLCLGDDDASRVRSVYVVSSSAAAAELRQTDLELLAAHLPLTTPIVTAGTAQVSIRPLGSLLPRRGGRLSGMSEASDDALPMGARELYGATFSPGMRAAGVLFEDGEVRVASDLKCESNPSATLDCAAQLLLDMLDAKARGVRTLVMIVVEADGTMVAPNARVRTLAEELGFGVVSVVVNGGVDGEAVQHPLTRDWLEPRDEDDEEEDDY